MARRVEQQKLLPVLPGDDGVWVFLTADIILFGLLFFTFLSQRMANVPLYNTSQEMLIPFIGALNTVFILTSSWSVAHAVQAARRGGTSASAGFLGGALICGGAFSVTKIIEYRHEFSQGVSMVTNDFFMFYFILTGIHFVHVIIGMIILTILLIRTYAGATGERHFIFLESGASYWHVVDLLWLMIFPLLYLAR